MQTENDQVVISGVGLITPLGLSLETTWRAVLAGRCGLGPMSAMESPLPPGAEGGQAPDLPPDFEPGMPRESRYLRYALLAALKDAGMRDRMPYPHDRCGIVLGTTLHGMRSGGRFFREGDPAVLRDFLAGGIIRNVTAGLPFAGAGMTTCSACSSSLGSVALACTLLRSGRLDLAIAGGYDAISEYVYGGFNSLRLVSPTVLRPFARGREGMKIAEGYGVVVLERSGDAHRRGHRPFAAVLGYGESADSHHLTQPHPQGEGAARAMRQAIASAGLTTHEIDLVAAHATGTPDNDASEFAAMSRVFDSRLAQLPVVAFKSHLGHTLGGAGAVELILSGMALREQTVPACANVRASEVEFPELSLATGAARPVRIRATLNTSLGFGGANTCVVLGPATARAGAPGAIVRDEPREREVFISGVGTLFPGLIGNEALVERLSRGGDPVRGDTGAIADEEIVSLLNARRVRRMSEYVKLTLAATMLSLRDADVRDVASFAETCGAVLGTAHASTNYCEQYYGQIVREGIAAANPMLFAEGVPNGAAAHLSLMLSLKGPCQTVIGSRTAGLDALRLAAARIASGEWERAIVGAADEFSPVVNAAYGKWRLHGAGGFVSGAGAVSLVLESRSSVESRGGRVRGRVGAAAGGVCRVSRMSRLARDVVRRLGSQVALLGSSNGTWIDRVEAAAGRERRAVPSLYGHVAECFSALPLGGIAAVLLTGELPRGLSTDAVACPRPLKHFGALAADYAGAVSGVRIDLATSY